MLFVLECRDRKDGLETRMATRTEHLDYIRSLDGSVLIAGPFLDNDDKPIGSMLIVKADNLEAVETIAKNDPYTKAGLFVDTNIRPWAWVINKPEGI